VISGDIVVCDLYALPHRAFLILFDYGSFYATVTLVFRLPFHTNLRSPLARVRTFTVTISAFVNTTWSM